jgi:predicted RNA-binding Zn-ribbon protein involved in translation (DUF1610 family)
MANSTLGNNVANTAGSVNFQCPKCRQTTILRSRNEREIAAKYMCSSCGFTGPN